jgi:hemolysin activation/secretion protein
MRIIMTASLDQSVKQLLDVLGRRHLAPVVKLSQTAGLAALLLGAGLTVGAEAQTASQLTRESYAPPVIRPVEGGMDLAGGTGLQAPAGAERLKVRPAGLLIKGGFEELAEETAEIEARISNKRVTGADLFAAARALEAAYARAGYLLVRVTLPPQTLKDGHRLKLIVTDGYVEAVDSSALPERARRRIDAVLAPLIGRDHLTKRELERRLLLAGDTPGMMLRSTLRAGSTTGAAILIVDGRYDAVTGNAGLNNSVSKEMGHYSASLGLNINTVLGLGEVGYFALAGYPGANDSVFSDDPRNRQIVGGVTLPLGTEGWWANVEAVISRTHPSSDLAYTMKDRFERYSGKLGYHWLRSRDANTASIIGFEVEEETQHLVISGSEVEFTKDKLRVLRFTQMGDRYFDGGGHLSGDLTASFGLDGLGARSGTAALPLSRDGAQPDFQKLALQTRYTLSWFGGQVQGMVAAKAQTSFGDPLVGSEQITLGGTGWLSAFDSGTIEGDAGAALRAELSLIRSRSLFPDAPEIGSAVSPYIFGALGLTKLENPTAVETEITRAGSFGAGLRIGLSEKASPRSGWLTFEYAHGAATDLDTEDRFSLGINTKF